jgi:hypothetical protein
MICFIDSIFSQSIARPLSLAGRMISIDVMSRVNIPNVSSEVSEEMEASLVALHSETCQVERNDPTQSPRTFQTLTILRSLTPTLSPQLNCRRNLSLISRRGRTPFLVLLIIAHNWRQKDIMQVGLRDFSSLLDR